MRVLQPADAPAPTDRSAARRAIGNPRPEAGIPSASTRAECELVEQYPHKIVPLFATRNVDLKTTCIPPPGIGDAAQPPDECSWPTLLNIRQESRKQPDEGRKAHRS